MQTPLARQNQDTPHRHPASAAMMFLAFVLSLLLSPALLFTNDNTAEAALTYRYGHVVARGVFLGPNDKPIFTEIGPDGRVIAEIGEAIGELDGAVVMDANAYRTLVQPLIAAVFIWDVPQFPAYL